MPSASTKPEYLQSLAKLKKGLIFKSGLLSVLREFFKQNDFIEVETPLIVNAPAPEEYIEAFSVSSSFLRTSPELQMKSLLAAGYERIYQIGPCFREGESGRIHRPEFTMLEWYQTGIDYNGIMNFTQKMISSAARQLLEDAKSKFRETVIDFSSEWQKISVRDAFLKYASMSPEDAIAGNIFEELLVEKVEPFLSKSVPCFMTDYPAAFSALAKLKASDKSVAERWELYIGGVEIANAYSELNNPVEQKDRFIKASLEREKRGMKKYPPPSEFLSAVDYGIPEAAGCALGIDRLAMVMSGATDLSEIVFPSDIA